MAPTSVWFSTCGVSWFCCVSDCIWKRGHFQQVVACLLPLLWLVCVHLYMYIWRPQAIPSGWLWGFYVQRDRTTPPTTVSTTIASFVSVSSEQWGADHASSAADALIIGGAAKDAPNHGCERPKRQRQIVWSFTTTTVRFSITTSSKKVVPDDSDNNRQLELAIWLPKPEVQILTSLELR